MPVRTTRLVEGASGAAGASVTVYTCPPGNTAIIKDIRLSPTNVNVGRGIVTISSGPRNVFLIEQAIPNGTEVGLSCWVVLLPGDIIKIFSDVSPGFTFWVSGTELEGVNP